MTLESLQDLYIEQLRTLYDAEVQLIDALPELADQATHTELRKTFEDQLEAVLDLDAGLRERSVGVFAPACAARSAATNRTRHGRIHPTSHLARYQPPIPNSLLAETRRHTMRLEQVFQNLEATGA